MRSLSDGEKLILIFFISLSFMFIILIIFHFFRKYRKDKLINEDDEDATRDTPGGRMDSKMIEMSDFKSLPNTLFINTKEKLKKLRQMSKDYSFFGWIKFVYNTNDKQVFSLCNAEGLMYLYFLRTTGFFFLIISIFSFVVFVPLFTVRFAETQEINLTTLQQLTIKNAYDSTTKLWIVLFFSLFYTVLAYFHVYNIKKKMGIVHRQVQTEDSMDSDIALHTLHIRGINRNLSYLDAKKILQSFFEIEFTGNIAEIQVIPHYDILINLIDRKFAAEAGYNKYRRLNRNKTGRQNISCTNIDGETFYYNWTRIINNMLGFYRKLNSNKNTGNAFICFSNPFVVEKILSQKNIIYGKKDNFHGQLLDIKNWAISRAPPPSDLIWENIKYTKKWRLVRMAIFTLILFVVCLMIITPNKIKEELDPLISEISDHIEDKDVRKFIKEYSYPLIVVIMNSGILPLAVYYISLFEKHYKRSYREKSILVKSFLFMIINTLFIPTFGILSISKLKAIYEHIKTNGWDYDLSAAFISNCYFFMRYIVQVTFLSNSIQLLALPQYIVKKLRILIARTEYEKFYASLIKKYFDYGFNYSFSITVFVLTLCFSTTIPLIAPFGCLFFYIKYFVDKYNLLFVYPVEFESHGNIGIMVLSFILVGIFFYQFIISNLFLRIFADKDYAVYATLLYLGFAVVMYYVSKRIFIKEQKRMSFTPDSVFEEIINKTTKTFLSSSNNLQNALKKPLIANKQSTMHSMNISHGKFLNLMKDAYIHPAEKRWINNPIQIWNDSYNFIKTIEMREEIRKKELIEYESIIKRNTNRESSIGNKE